MLKLARTTATAKLLRGSMAEGVMTMEKGWNSLSNGTHLFESTLSIFKRHSIARIKRVYGISFKHMNYHLRLSTLSRCSNISCLATENSGLVAISLC